MDEAREGVDWLEGGNDVGPLLLAVVIGVILGPGVAAVLLALAL